MITLVIKNNSSNAHQFLAFARTLPYVDVIEDIDTAEPQLKKSVAIALKKSEQGKDLNICKSADDMFTQLGI
ncbi:MAG: hypothetical protein LBF81_06090 [Prevotellaceae bacterium]|jgi:hypothetical protein|nr:hypothetical protein [Prevotellaceae bacterium]